MTIVSSYNSYLTTLAVCINIVSDYRPILWLISLTTLSVSTSICTVSNYLLFLWPVSVGTFSVPTTVCMVSDSPLPIAKLSNHLLSAYHCTVSNCLFFLYLISMTTFSVYNFIHMVNCSILYPWLIFDTYFSVFTTHAWWVTHFPFY